MLPNTIIFHFQILLLILPKLHILMISVAIHNFLIYLLNNNMSTNMNVSNDAMIKDFTVLVNNIKTILAEINY